MLVRVEHFLDRAGFDRAPWLSVAFALGIAAWFAMANVHQWLALLSGMGALAVGAVVLMPEDGKFPFVRQALVSLALVAAAGCAVVWTKSALQGMPAIAAPWVGKIEGRVLLREEEPAEERVRLTLATREAETGRPIQVRINVPLERDAAQAQEGALVRFKARLVPPAPPMLPGSYDFSRAAWFQGLAATGSALDPVEVAEPGKPSDDWLARMQRRISDHVRANVPGSAGGIAAAFASGDRGGIAKSDEDAMRDSGLTHLLSVSGLHVSAVIGITYFLAMRLLALWPWLVLRLRLPLAAAGCGALAAIAYTLLTGAQVPTVRSCVGALLILVALVIGREALSLRLVAVAAFVVMLVWPEAVVGPSFQMSFASVIAIVALHGSAPMRAFRGPREDRWWQRGARNAAMLLITGVVIEAALMPIALYHFHRAGVYGALANVVAIPMTEVVTMPLIGLGFLLDAVGLGRPAWWLAGKSLEGLLGLAHFAAGLPGAVNHFPAMGVGGFLLFVIGLLWLALWHGSIRLIGFVPIFAGVLWLVSLRAPDLLIAGDGAHVGITRLSPDSLVVLREPRSDYSRENMTEIAGMSGSIMALADLPGARCNAAFCAFDLPRGGRTWRLLMARGAQPVALRDLTAACELSDIVIADRWLPPACHPKVLKADRHMLGLTGGLAIDLENGRMDTVAAGQGEHGWWRPVKPRVWKPATTPPQSANAGASATASPAPSPPVQ
ncbi:MAG: ComEC/Rec2 family competence protein [Novosphingobium sp.]